VGDAGARFPASRAVAPRRKSGYRVRLEGSNVFRVDDSQVSHTPCVATAHAIGSLLGPAWILMAGGSATPQQARFCLGLKATRPQHDPPHQPPRFRNELAVDAPSPSSRNRTHQEKVLDLRGRLRCRECGKKGRAAVSIKWRRQGT
jgi:hypothetical protein